MFGMQEDRQSGGVKRGKKGEKDGPTQDDDREATINRPQDHRTRRSDDENLNF
jgi:hypothetical protein